MRGAVETLDHLKIVMAVLLEETVVRELYT